MKKLLLSAALLSLSAFTASAQCNTYFPFKVGSTYEYNMLNKKGKIMAVSTTKVIEVSDSGNLATIESTSYTPKMVKASAVKFNAECIDGDLFIDMSYYLPGSNFDSLMVKDIDWLVIPAEVKEGDTLPDVYSSWYNGKKTDPKGLLKSSSLLSDTICIKIYDRKVESVDETITVPAGTFKCFKITSKSRFQMDYINEQTSFNGHVTDNSTKVHLDIITSFEEYHSPHIGLVKATATIDTGITGEQTYTNVLNKITN